MQLPDIRYTHTRDGARIAYGLYAGSGVPVLSVSWPGAAPLPMAHQISAVIDSLDAVMSGQPGIRVDLRGIGFSGPASGKITIAQQALDFEAVCEAVGEPVDAVAWCISCFAMVSLAAERPELFRTLTLVAPDYEGCDSHYGPLYAARSEMSELEWVETIILRWYDIPVQEVRRIAELWVRFAPEKTARAQMAATFEGSLAETAPRISVPTGVLSYRLSEPQASRVAASIPGCKFKFVDELFVGAEGGRQIRMLMDSLLSPAPSKNGARHDLMADCGWPRERDIVHRNGNGAASTGGLSAREREVLTLIAAGSTNPEIAMALTIAPATASRHVHNILGKLGMSRRSEAAAWWTANGNGFARD